eukprot:4840334-Amphidinium_carterae.1
MVLKINFRQDLAHVVRQQTYEQNGVKREPAIATLTVWFLGSAVAVKQKRKNCLSTPCRRSLLRTLIYEAARVSSDKINNCVRQLTTLTNHLKHCIKSYAASGDSASFWKLMLQTLVSVRFHQKFQQN